MNDSLGEHVYDLEPLRHKHSVRPDEYELTKAKHGTVTFGLQWAPDPDELL